MRKFFRFIRNLILLGILIFGIFIFIKSNKKKVLLIGSSQMIGSSYYEVASSYNYEIHILTGVQTNEDTSRDIIKSVDGVIFAGGDDFDPSLYGSNAYDLVETYSTDQDRSDLELLGLAIEERKPILGICRGMQLINIYYGGSLYEDLPSQFGTSISHRDGSDGFAYHRINFNESSRLYHKLGEEKSREVNSMHHEGIRTLAKGLLPTATSDDGLVEAIENPYYDSYMMGVQWHPEYSWGKFDELTKIIFDDFSKAL
ncbi:gamma-glutamyl-gamma-aminobutyrate hydrolase family protein [Anaerococcus sp. NML200537]|uniref:gamma-glutamyl-gamma-aminobutyrate hydrolase family protein n=1 Tax=Anaerococcus sp. NML200537 TaxID=2954485 RepID=UPI0022379325|nr:gamma-glutamyl-gamma-aminobutyrate hydrolase family protein [Anaerococcus sp. NML200537]MCW6700961.1 gamma-glutamyl-gamma-aminobutyrate hydrolase family protein [Anaerococcus sp. NML200537]